MAEVLGAQFGATSPIQIGDYAYANTSDEANISIERIPRATGVIVKFMGGGSQKITVIAWVVSDSLTRKPIQDLLRDLASNLIAKSPDTLTVRGTTYTNSHYTGFSEEDSGGKHFARFSVTFTRSTTGGPCN